MKTSAITTAVLSCSLLAGTAHAGQLYSRAGWVANLPLGFHSVQGRATIIDERTIQIEHFTYDGGGPAVYFYLGATNSQPAFASGLRIYPLLSGTPYSDDSITLTLAANESLDGYGAISVWCDDVKISFSSASFQPPAGGAYDRAGYSADIMGVFHSVQGKATIINERIIFVEHFTYDGTAPLVYFYLGGNDTYDAYLNGLELPPLLNRAYNDESLVLTLPDGDTLDPWGAIAVWCAQFNVNFGSAVFKLDVPEDVDDDGDVDLDDYDVFADCLGGPAVAPSPVGVTVQQCLDAFDANSDGFIDASDFASFQRAYTGPPPATAQYELTFDATWSAATHPTDFPSNAHFSGLVGGTHNDSVTFWHTGSLASAGIESMAETGSKTQLTAEVNAEITAGNAGEVISGSGIGSSPGTVSVTFTASLDFPLATVTSMIAPSPDWFVGVSGYPLFMDNQWVGEISIPLNPYDAGTDSGTTYTSPDDDTVPHGAITQIHGYPFQSGLSQPPLGTFTFRRIN